MRSGSPRNRWWAVVTSWRPPNDRNEQVASLGGATTLISNVVVARLWNKDLLVWSDLLGVGFVVGGAIFCACMATEQPRLSHVEMRHRFKNEWVIAYLVSQVVVVLVLLAGVASTVVHRLKNQAIESVLSPLFHRLEEQDHRISELEVSHVVIISIVPGRASITSSLIEKRVLFFVSMRVQGHLSYVHSKLTNLQRHVKRVAADLQREHAGFQAGWNDLASTCRTLPVSQRLTSY